MIQKTTTLRLRRVRFKNGNTVEVLRTKNEDIVARLYKTVAHAIEDASAEVVGYALVMWNADGTVFPAYYNGKKSPILSGQVPQYAKDCLLTETAARWAEDD